MKQPGLNGSIVVARAGLCAVALILAVTSSSCGAGSHDELTAIGRPLDQSKISRIKSGETTFSDVLTLLGPPSFIVVGQRQLVDEEAFFAGFRGSPKIRSRPISTRQIQVPPDTVLLIYGYMEVKRKQQVFATGLLPFPKDEIAQYIVRESRARANELFIYLSERDQKVLSLSYGTP